ncbi:MAG: circularly permuted type 2 ATP-grasp protein [Anaerolineae bacterium]|nr:circularly permuted type 2 ATP-grasp protein [Anaerolineae bacterium]
MKTIVEIIREYNDLMTPEVAAEADALLRQRQHEKGTYFGDRPLCTVLRPHFYSLPKWDVLRGKLEAILSAFIRAHEVCCDSAEHRATLGLYAWEEQLFHMDTSQRRPWTSSRVDTFWIADSEILNSVEYNAETPAGIGYNDILCDVFDELEPMRRFRQLYSLQPMRAMPHLFRAVLAGYQDWGGAKQAAPQVGILDWEEVPTRSEHEIIRQYFEQQGIVTRLGDPRALEYRAGHLWLDDFRIDLIYKRVLYSELVERMGLDNPVLRAVREGAVYITNSPACKLMAKKASLAFLSDDRQRHLFTARQLAAIDESIPWTRVVAERSTQYRGQTVDLVPFIVDNQSRLVLKPNDDYGGRGVVLGWDCSGETWQQTLQLALNEPYVVQERVPVVERHFPAMLHGTLDISPRFVDADPYVFHGSEVYGVLTRLSSRAILNVTAGAGSVVPAYIVAPR